MLAWHFIRDDHREQFGEQVVAPGYTYEVDPPIELCCWGLHASVKPLDALGEASDEDLAAARDAARDAQNKRLTKILGRLK